MRGLILLLAVLGTTGCGPQRSVIMLSAPVSLSAVDGSDGNAFAQAIADGGGQWLFTERAHGVEVTFATFSTADGIYDMARPQQPGGGDFDYFDPVRSCHADTGTITIRGSTATFDVKCTAMSVVGEIVSAL